MGLAKRALALFMVLCGAGCAAPAGITQWQPASLFFTLSPSVETIATTDSVQLTLGGASGSSGQIQSYDTTCVNVSPSNVTVGQAFTVTAKGVPCHVTITVVVTNIPAGYNPSPALASITVQ